VLKGITIQKTTGDGIILEGSYEAIADGGRVCSNIRILNCTISDCRRQGISVIGATDSEISGNRIYDISGTDPQYGIDVEPEFDYIVDNLKIHDNTISGCSGGAICCNKGSNYEVYRNTCIGNNIWATKPSNVRIYQNTIKESFIRVLPDAQNVTVANNTLDSKSWIKVG
jgi:parallel beta-helix repeat protein